jgi:hypothetical protein
VSYSELVSGVVQEEEATGKEHKGMRTSWYGPMQANRQSTDQSTFLSKEHSIWSCARCLVGPHLEFPGVNVVPEDAGRAGVGEDVCVPQHDAPVGKRPVAGLRPRAVVVHERDSLQHERPQVNQAPAACSHWRLLRSVPRRDAITSRLFQETKSGRD